MLASSACKQPKIHVAEAELDGRLWRVHHRHQEVCTDGSDGARKSSRPSSENTGGARFGFCFLPLVSTPGIQARVGSLWTIGTRGHDSVWPAC
jgi:hypothetical protein